MLARPVRRLGGRRATSAFSSGVKDANKRLDPRREAALTQQSGLLISHPTTILLLGTDNAQIGGRTATGTPTRSCSSAPTRSHHRIAYLSIPRDLARADPRARHAEDQRGVSRSAARRSRSRRSRASPGSPINHVVVVNFADFKDLIDALGGIDVDVPKPILSNRFDCPYTTQARCQNWQGWRFAKGTQHMNGQRALIYSRIRENRLDPRETDVTRGARQQAVIQAVAREVHVAGHAHRHCRSTAARS